MELDWIQDLIVGFCSVMVLLFAILKKFGILEMPLKVGSSGNGEVKQKIVHREQLPGCRNLFSSIQNEVGSLETFRTKSRGILVAHEKRLDKGEDKFAKIMETLTRIDTEVSFIADGWRKQNGGKK